MVACEAVGIAPVVPVDSQGQFTTEVPDYVGQQVFDANKPIIADLKAGTGPLARVARGPAVASCVRHETYEHSYPHCWRCRNPLIYKAVTSWFVRVSEFRDRMVELNQDITWTPEHIKDGQFGKWLSNARDWSISRNRYWGTPIPVWVSRRPGVPARRRLRLAGRAGGGLRPGADERGGRAGPAPTVHRRADAPEPGRPDGCLARCAASRTCSTCGSTRARCRSRRCTTRSRTPTGSSTTTRATSSSSTSARPAAGSTRCTCWPRRCSTARRSATSCATASCWATTAARPASRCATSRTPPRCGTCTAPTPCAGSSCRARSCAAGNLIVGEEGIRDGVRQVLLPLWSTYYFFSLYAGAADGGAGYTAKPVDAATRVADARADGPLRPGAHATTWSARVTAQLDAYDISAACETVREHLDVLTNWYVRTQRDRFWAEDADAFDTLWTSLEVLTRVMAPLAPLVTEEVWRGLTGGRSVHLTDWPTVARRGRRRGARRRDGPGPRGDVDRARPAQGRGRARPAAAAHAHGRGRRRGRARAVRRPARGRAQRQGASTWSRPTPAPPSGSASRSGSRSTPVPPVRGWVAGCRRSSRPRAPGAGASTATRSWYHRDGDVALEPSEYELTTVVGGGGRRRRACCPAAGSSCST